MGGYPAADDAAAMASWGESMCSAFELMVFLGTLLAVLGLERDIVRERSFSVIAGL